MIFEKKVDLCCQLLYRYIKSEILCVSGGFSYLLLHAQIKTFNLIYKKENFMIQVIKMQATQWKLSMMGEISEKEQ